MHVLFWIESISPSNLQKSSYPSWVSTSHFPAKAILVVLVVGGEMWEQRCWGKLREKQGTETENVPCLYTVHLSPPPSSACDDTREQLKLKMMTTIGYEGEGNNLHKWAFMDFPSSE